MWDVKFIGTKLFTIVWLFLYWFGQIAIHPRSLKPQIKETIPFKSSLGNHWVLGVPYWGLYKRMTQKAAAALRSHPVHAPVWVTANKIHVPTALCRRCRQFSLPEFSPPRKCCSIRSWGDCLPILLVSEFPRTCEFHLLPEPSKLHFTFES